MDVQIELVCVLPNQWAVRKKVDSYEYYIKEYRHCFYDGPPEKSEFLKDHPEFRYWYWDYGDKEFKKYLTTEYVRKYCVTGSKWKARRVYDKLLCKERRRQANNRALEVVVCETFNAGEA